MARRSTPTFATFACLTSVLALASLVAVAACGDASDDPNATPGGPRTSDGDPDAGDGSAAVDVPACIVAPGRDTAPTRRLDDGAGSATVTVSGEACARSFVLATTADRRDDLPASPRTVAEEPSRPSISTRNDLFDALYQLAQAEAKEGSVDAIKDGAFRNGAPVSCAEGGCYETGRKWNYVWTRDTAYAVDLGLGWLDPTRARNSLDFKLSTRRDGSDLQIVQDTGTGGSYPVSTDRVVWALGAREVLRHLDGDARTAFRDRALTAIANTHDHDREVAFDPSDGLYRGEQSFLDWREQSYPAWSVPDVVTIATSKSLSTNVLHLVSMDTGAALAKEKGDAALEAKLSDRATALRKAIRDKLWLPQDKQFSTYLTTDLDGAPARRFDLLGTSLAVLFDVATAEQAKDAIASYPTLPKGPPVIFPEQKETAIYHNRAIWPFVTAYWVRAARKVGNDAAFDNGMRSLVRGAALFLSNMENLEVVTGKPWVADGVYSGPVVNSQRQIWSVAGYLGTVNGALFGVEALDDGTRAARVAPFVTKALRRTTFAASDALVLNDLPLRAKKLSIVIRLPKASEGEGAYRVAKVTLNGKTAEGGILREADLAARNLVEVELAEPTTAPGKLKTISDLTDYRVLYAPRTPAITSVSVSVNGKLAITIDHAGEAAADVAVDVYRDGVRVAEGVPGGTTTWEDAATSGETSPGRCYTVEQRYPTGTVSQRARPMCFWGTGYTRIASVSAPSFTVTGGTSVNAYGRTFYESWGDSGHSLSATFAVTRTGEHLVQAIYGNGSGGLNTGITCAVKRVRIEEVGGPVVTTGYLVMPQRSEWSSWGDSSFVRATLQAGKTYRVTIDGEGRAMNMSAFAHFADYTGGTGGAAPFFRVNIAEIKLLARVP